MYTLQFDGCEPTPLKSETVMVGRTPDNDIQLDHESVSGHHARLVLLDGQYVIEDLGSTNGIEVNGHRSTQARLSPDDRVRLGAFEATYCKTKSDTSTTGSTLHTRIDRAKRICWLMGLLAIGAVTGLTVVQFRRSREVARSTAIGAPISPRPSGSPVNKEEEISGPDPKALRDLTVFEMEKFGYSEDDLPGLTDSLTEAVIVFHSSASSLLTEMAQFESVLEAGGLSGPSDERSIQAQKGAWRCVIWPRVVKRSFTDKGQMPPPYKQLVAGSIKEHALFYHDRGKGFQPVSEPKLKAAVWRLNDSFSKELKWQRRPVAESESVVMTSLEQATLVADIVNGTNSAPEDRTVLAFALSSETGEQLLKRFRLSDQFGFNFKFKLPGPKSGAPVK